MDYRCAACKAEPSIEHGVSMGHNVYTVRCDCFATMSVSRLNVDGTELALREHAETITEDAQMPRGVYQKSFGFE